MTNFSSDNQTDSMAAASAILLQAASGITDVNNGHQEPAGDSGDCEVYHMTSGLFSCVCVAMYETLLSPQVFEDHMNDGEEEFYYDTVDFDDWKKSLTEAAQDYLDDSVIDSLRNYGLLGIKATGIWSPKYYNYHQDELEMTITMQKDWQKIMAEKVAAWQDRDDVKKYISKYWHSYSGYVNLMPESLDEVLTEHDEDRQLAAYLTLAMLVEGTLRPYDEILEDLYYRMDDFSDYHRVNVIEEYYRDAFEAQELIKLWDDDLRWNELYWTLCEKIGMPWRYDNDYDRLDGKKDCCFGWQADSDGKRMLFWAVKQELTVKELQDMAA